MPPKHKYFTVRRLIPGVVLFLVFSFSASKARADVVVIANHSLQRVALAAPDTKGKWQAQYLEVGDVRFFPVKENLEIVYRDKINKRYLKLAANHLYQFDTTTDSRLIFSRVQLYGDKARAARLEQYKHPRVSQPVTIRVRLLEDDDQQAAKKVWHDQIRKRFEAAAAIVAKHCPVRFEIADIAQWESSPINRDFAVAKQEFADEAPLGDAHLAIGFTNQFRISAKQHKGRHLTHFMASHLLLPEYSRDFTEADRLELLVQALGHYLGAHMTRDSFSVMRDSLGDGRSRDAKSSIRFDGPNTLVMNLVAEELAANVRAPANMSTGTKLRLKEIYTQFGKQFSETGDVVAADTGAGNQQPSRGDSSPEKPSGSNPPATNRESDPSDRDSQDKGDERIAAPADDENSTGEKKTDADNILGKWKISMATLDDKPIPQLLGKFVLFGRETVSIATNQFGDLGGKYRLYEQENPKQIEVQRSLGSLNFVQKTGYELHGDSLKTSLEIAPEQLHAELAQRARQVLEGTFGDKIKNLPSNKEIDKRLRGATIRLEMKRVK